MDDPSCGYVNNNIIISVIPMGLFLHQNYWLDPQGQNTLDGGQWFLSMMY